MIQLPYLTSGDSNINRFMDLFIKSDFSSLAHIAYHSGPPQARSKHCVHRGPGELKPFGSVVPQYLLEYLVPRG